MIEWLSWLPYKSNFANSGILETSRDRPNTLLGVKRLEERVHELVWEGWGGCTESLPVRQRCGEQKLRSGTVMVAVGLTRSTDRNLKQIITIDCTKAVIFSFYGT